MGITDNHRFGPGLSKSLDTLKKLFDLKVEMNIKWGGVNDYQQTPGLRLLSPSDVH